MVFLMMLIDSEEDRSKFEVIYKSYRNLMFHIANSILGNETDSCRNFFEGIRLCRFLAMPESLIQRFQKVAYFDRDTEGMDLILRSVVLDIIAYAIETKQYERFSQIVETEKQKREHGLT